MFLFNFLRSQFFATLPFPSKDRTGETIIVTGANTGLGLEAARHFTRLNASTVILACRNTQKGETAARSIESSTGRKGAVEVWPLDLSSYESVIEFAKRASSLPRLDAVVENAGIATETFRRAEGEEATIVTNVISTFLLALLLLPKLRETAQRYNKQGHLSVVTSEIHYLTQLPERHAEDLFAALASEKESKMGERYPVSKLLEIFYLRELAATTKANGHQDVVINMINPGFCHSELTRESSIMMGIMKFFLARSTEKGSRTLVHATEQGQETHGAYLSDCTVAKVAPLVSGSEGPEIQRRVWEGLNRKLEGIQPGVTGNV